MKKIKDLIDLEPTKPFIETKKEETLYSDSINILGFCFDGTTSFRPGTRFGPDAIREASFGLETYSPYLDKDTNDRNVIDLGNLAIHPSRFDLTVKNFEENFDDVSLKENNIRLVTLGGEHSISYAPIKKYLSEYPDMVLLHLDAHADLRDGYLGEKHSHASIIFRVREHFSKSNSLIQYGIRSGTKEEFEDMNKNSTLRKSLEDLCDSLKNIPNDRPIYLTLDLDYFDPAYVPGTGTPEAGGEDFHSFIKIAKILSEKNFVGADVVELSPQIDSSGNSSCFASKVVREILLALR